jgi:metal-responsive CopG/Arc/MetJ family transcriptional regulator
MKSSTVNISFNEDLLKQIDKVAREESRSRSELIREAARSYIDRKRKWDQIFIFSEKQAEKKNITEKDIDEEIRSYRKSRTNKA